MHILYTVYILNYFHNRECLNPYKCGFPLGGRSPSTIEGDVYIHAYTMYIPISYIVVSCTIIICDRVQTNHMLAKMFFDGYRKSTA